LIWSNIIVYSANHENPHYAICSNLVLLPPTWAQIASSASYARMHLVYVLNTYSLISLRNEYVFLMSMFLWDVVQHQWVTGAQCFETAWWFHSQGTKCQKQWTSIT
jgi:hypothetical protein